MRKGSSQRDGNQDFGLFDITEQDADMYKFRTSPLRNIATQPTFFHNGAFTRLEDALRYHVNTLALAVQYNPAQAGVDEDLTHNTGPIAQCCKDWIQPSGSAGPLIRRTIFKRLLVFLRDGLLDRRSASGEFAKANSGDCSERPSAA